MIIPYTNNGLMTVYWFIDYYGNEPNIQNTYNGWIDSNKLLSH